MKFFFDRDDAALVIIIYLVAALISCELCHVMYLFENFMWIAAAVIASNRIIELHSHKKFPCWIFKDCNEIKN